MLVTARDDLLVAQPLRIDDLGVEPPTRLVRDRARGERETHERRTVVRRLPAIDADEREWLDAPCRFLERFARGAIGQRLAGLEMPGRLVQAQSAPRPLADEQERAVTFDDGGDGHCGPRGSLL